ncbi:molybdate ABC transporter substrate-binding protein [Sneathiella sp.]|uniref:molybdate ABC transporter substrate-binding protein n=1 Tax=Sneathiella sp. TaxID=1964365 RepID=UPI002FE21EDE
MKIDQSRLRGFYKAVLAAVAALLLSMPARASAEEVVTFAAASLGESVAALGKAFEKKTGFPVIASFAGSGVLARQINEGAPANLFISADTRWMDYLDDAKRLIPGSVVTIASNSLVLVARDDVEVAEDFDLATLPDVLGQERLAIGDPAHVPVGSYSKAALENLGLWQRLEKQTVRLANVRAVTALIERGEVPFAIIYETDYRLVKNVKLVKAFPAETHPPIVYAMAMIRDGDTHSAKLFYEFIRSDEGRDIIRRFGFTATEN